MKEIRWVKDTPQIQIEPPTNTKKVTGTRFAAILGLNHWHSPFEMWCAITKTYEKPFEDTIYTLAGKTIEPKQAEYMKVSYGMTLLSPTDLYGENYFKKTRGDFFPYNPHFGGMWDYLGINEDGDIDTVFEMKTTKRIEDWKDDIPEYYALQAALYAYLLGVDNVVMVASFLDESDYNDPSNYKPNITNTIVDTFKLSERYPRFNGYIKLVEDWWEEFIERGISPYYNEKRDAEILQVLRTNTLSPETDITALITEAETLKSEVDTATAAIADKEKRLKTLNNLIKEHAVKQFREGDKKVEVKGSTYCWTVSRSEVKAIDKDKLKADGLLEKYEKINTQYRMTIK